MTTLDDLPLRDDLRGQTPYGAPQAKVPVALNVNENTHPVPPIVEAEILAEVERALVEVNRYPDREFVELREAFARYLGHGLDASQIWAANGSNEVLQHVLQAFGGPGRTAFGFAPTYSMYPLLTRGTGATWIAGERGADFVITPEAGRRQVAEAAPDIVLLCAPNNPTGTPLGLDVVEAVYDATDAVVIVDEAYHEFAPHDAPSALSLLPGRPRLAVSRTMSKAFAFAGGRLGYLAASPAIVDALQLVRLPYHLSVLTQAAARAALRHADETLGGVAKIIAERKRVVAELEKAGFDVVDSDANFVLFGRFADAPASWQRYLDNGVLIRDVGIPAHLRVTIGLADENDAFLDVSRKLATTDLEKSQ